MADLTDAQQLVISVEALRRQMAVYTSEILTELEKLHAEAQRLVAAETGKTP